MVCKEVRDKSYIGMLLLLHAMDIREKEELTQLSLVSDYSYISKNGYTCCPVCLRKVAKTNSGKIRKHFCLSTGM